MEAKIKKGEIVEYKIGQDILIHRHIRYPEKWHLRIELLDIISLPFCNISASESEIKMSIAKILDEKVSDIEKISNILIND